MAKVAILNPMGDYGQNTYGHELAEAVGKAGYDVLFLTCGPEHIFSELPDPRHHERKAVLGSFLARQLGPFRRRTRQLLDDMGPASSALAPPSSPGGPSPSTIPAEPSQEALQWRARAMTWELLAYAKLRGVRWLWTQWPDLWPYSGDFRERARQSGFRLAHTVHNVLPHEAKEADRVIAESVYQASDLLFVHSEQARARLFREFPGTDPGKVHMYRLGAYTTYPRMPETRAALRASWGVRPEQSVWLSCGLIRPYKNVDSLLRAFAQWENRDAVLVVQGMEAGFPGASREAPLRHTKARVEELGLAQRVRLLPGEVNIREMSALMEAADALALPYKQGSGSGLLSVALGFGLHILAAKVGGAEEYVEEYGWGTLLEDCGVEDILRGLRAAEEKLQAAAGKRGVVPASLSWEESGRAVARALEPFGK